MEGNVRWFNRVKNYGFIDADDGEAYFIHGSELSEGLRGLRENDRVSFEAIDSQKGKQAKNVKLLQKGSERSDVAPSQKPVKSGRGRKPKEESEESEEAEEDYSEEEEY